MSKVLFEKHRHSYFDYTHTPELEFWTRSEYATYLSSLELVFVSFKFRKRKLEEQLAAPK